MPISYQHSSTRRHVNIGGQTIMVDSQLEEKVIRRLDKQGYQGAWYRPVVGLSVRGKRYTPDLELAVLEHNLTQRALVEIKPALAFFSQDIAVRMAAVARFYHKPLLLLYCEREKQWYRLDRHTLKLTQTELPPPGAIPIGMLARPWGIRARTIFDHQYMQPAQPFMRLLTLFTLLLGEILSALFHGPPNKTTYSRRRYK